MSRGSADECREGEAPAEPPAATGPATAPPSQSIGHPGLAASAADARPRRNRIQTVRAFQELGLLIVLLVLVVAASVCVDNFCTTRNFTSIVRNVANVVIISGGLTLLVISKGIDLSVGSVMALVSVVTALVYRADMPWPAAVAAGIASGLLVGLLNAVLVNQCRLNPILTTLATMTSIRGLAYVLARGVPIPMKQAAVVWLGEGEVAWIPVPVLLAGLVTVALLVVQRGTVFGIQTFAVGGNEEAARHCGIAVTRIKYRLYLLSSLCAALAGMIITGRFYSGQPTAGNGMEFDAITAVVVGGTSLDGGIGRVLGTVIGAVFIAVINNVMVLLGCDYYMQLVAKGVIIVLAIIVDQRIRRLGGLTRG